MFFLKIVHKDQSELLRVLTLQQIVLSKNRADSGVYARPVLTLQQIVLSKNTGKKKAFCSRVLTLQQIVLSKNALRN